MSARALLLMFCAPVALLRVPPEAAIRHVKAADVATLDRTLSAQPLSEWFPATVGAAFHDAKWDVIRCGLAKGHAEGDPVCVRVEAQNRLRRVMVVAVVDVRVGTVGGSQEAPSVYGVEVWVLPTQSRSVEDADALDAFFRGERLSELRPLLDRANVHVRRTDGN